MATANTSQAATPTPRPSPKVSPPPPRVSPTPRIMPSPAAAPGGEIITLDPTPSPFPSPPTSPSPVPILYLTKVEPFTTNNKNFIRYSYDVLNRMDYPAALFAAAPGLPPCGANTNSSRTWVDFFNQGGTRIYGFCALGKPEDLGEIWFALEEGIIPPSWIYIELNDRQTNTKYKSNLADTSQ
ncbi:MAG TPA: hypothetical protein VNP98_12820 [Chthoniobacterales bacterium]|nr:hypothetical protein [Chthoniobacterales bacterium]